MTTLTEEKSQFRLAWLPRMVGTGMFMLLVLNIVIAAAALYYQFQHKEMIYPGVSVWGIDVGGMDDAQAMNTLRGQFSYPSDVVIMFVDEETGTEWFITSEELGVGFDVDQTVAAAQQIGRRSTLLGNVQEQALGQRIGIEVSPVVNYNEAVALAYLAGISAEINRPAQDATLSVDGLRATAQPSQIGREVDVAATLEALQGQVVDLESGRVPLVINEIQPRVASADEAAETVNQILSAPLEVYINEPIPGDPGPWQASQEALAEMIVTQRVSAADGGERYTVRLNEDQLRAFLDPLATDLVRQPQDARYDFDLEANQLVLLETSYRGRTLNMGQTIQLINQMAVDGEQRVPLVFDYEEPQYAADMTGEELGIVGLVSSASTFFAGSSDARRVNIQEAAGRFNGIMIEPGAEFSFNEHLGDVSLESGFEEALIIYDGRTIEGVGGGVCQVSTTAFQAAFFAGFPITERYPHGYRVSYYEVGEGAGLDATVYSPIVDMKFVNDTQGHLLITTEVDVASSTITFFFYGTPDGRTVQKDGPYIENITPHGEPIYEVNPELNLDEVQQVDFAVDGADVTVNRTVYRDGEILYQDSFFSRYIPWQAIYQVAPGSPQLSEGG